MLGRGFIPWQRHVTDIAHEIDIQTGLLAYRTVIVIAPRQEGKTELMLPLMTHRSASFDDAHVSKLIRERLGVDVPDPGPQQTLYIAQNTDKSREKWRDIHLPRLQNAAPIRGMFHARLQRNQEAFLWKNGSMWRPGSTTPGAAGTGDTLDLGVIDEAWSRPDSRVELGLRPAMKTRQWRQLWIISMVPGPTRCPDPNAWAYLKHWRQVGRARVSAGVDQDVAFFDFTAPPDMDPGDPATWWTCMPGLGHISDEASVREAYTGMDLEDFKAEYLGWEPDFAPMKWTLLPRSTWMEDRLDRASGFTGRPALAVEVAEDRSTGWVGAAGFRADGDWHVEVVEPGYKIAPGVAGTSWIVPRVREIVDDQKACTVVIDPRRPAASLIRPLRNAGVDVLTPTQLDIAGACGRFYDAAVAEKGGMQLYHIGQPELDRAVATAKKYDLGNGAFTFVRKSSGLTISPLYTVVLAMLGMEVKGSAVLPEPDIHFMSDEEWEAL